jgi:hypothetical protein
MVKMGPNDTRHAVWALDVCFFLRVYMYILTNVFIVYLGSNVNIWDGETEGGRRR